MPRRLRRERLSPWVELCEIDTGPVDRPRTYHALAVPDYATLLGFTPSGEVLVIRQFRPILDAVVMELPSGMVDLGEDPLRAACREAVEETGFAIRAAQALAPLAVDGGRLLNRAHGVVAVVSATPEGPGEAGIEVGRLGWSSFAAHVAAGALVQSNHVALVAQALVDPAAAAFLEAHGITPPWRTTSG